MTADLDERALADLQKLLDAVPPPFEPLDVSMLDGYLCGVLLQPKPVPQTQWLRHVPDVDGRETPPSLNLEPLHRLVKRRHAELDHAIAKRQWFDPWVYELDDEDAMPSDEVMPWVAGFATAMELFPALMRMHDAALLEPLALLYMHLDPDDLEDADALIAEIETIEPPTDLAEAVETLVRATLLIADISRPQRHPVHPPARPSRKLRR
jgi:uncharacterized protein